MIYKFRFIEIQKVSVYNKNRICGDVMGISDKLIVTIDAIDHQGRGIVHLNDFVIFVFDALIGEEIEIEITKIKKKIVEAKVTKILKMSSERVESKCPYFKECGGCDLLHMSYSKQLFYKENKVKEIMKKFAHLENVVENIVPNDNVFGYRNKVVFQVKEKIGFFGKKSNELVEVEKCLLLPDIMNEYLSILKSKMNLSFVNQVMIRYSEYEQKLMIVFDVTREFSNSQIPLKELSNVSVLIKRENNYEILLGNNFLLERVGEYIFKISPDSFFQVNTKQMEKLYQLVLDHSRLMGKEKVLDLYCGTGTIGIFFSKTAKEVLGIEINESAIKDALWNKKENCIHNINFMCGDTGSVLKETSFHPDLVVVDPPRAGLDTLAISQIKKIQASKVIYVSCDPVTLARDISLLDEDYEVITIIPVDMFSNTYHVECVCVLEKRKE